ncbi:MAG: YceH family protein [Gaiellaceae bacterium]
MTPIKTLDPVQLRVLGCLIEKQRTTPDQYPLSLNALRLACNQATNRDPVVDYDGATVREAVQRLGTIGWSRLASGPGSRVPKYRHLLEEALDLLPSETAVLAMLMLRGPQTPAELRARTERLHRFAGAGDVEATLRGLGDRELAIRLDRRPGEREERWAHLLGENGHGPTPTPPAEPAPLEPRLAALEARVEEIERLLGERDLP